MSQRPPLVTILADRHIPADRAEGAQVLQLGTALAHGWGGDAHMQQGHSGHGRRFTKEDAATLTAIAFDFDGINHQATPEWRAEISAKAAMLLHAHPGGVFFSTRGGARAVFALPEPFEVNGAESAREWSRRYMLAVAYLKRRFGLVADLLHDYPRLFRLPDVLRDGVRTEPNMVGDPRAIGAFVPELTPEDHEAAATAAPKLFDESPVRAPLCGAAALASTAAAAPHIEKDRNGGFGLLHELLSKRGEIRGPRGGFDAPAFIVKCPNAKSHSTGSDETLLITSAMGGPGWLTCRHSGCRGIEPHEWLALLGVTYRDGIVRRTFINPGPRGTGIRLGVDLDPTDGAEPIGYLRISSGTSAWLALWRAADVEIPCDLDHDGDLGGALDELLGKPLRIELQDGRTRRILHAASSAAKAAA